MIPTVRFGISSASIAADPSHQAAQITIPSADVEVSPRQASNLALILNELVTNSIKHGRGPGNRLALSLEAGTDGEFITVCYRDFQRLSRTSPPRLYLTIRV